MIPSPQVHPDVTRVVALLRGAGLTPPVAGSLQDVREYLERMTEFVSASSTPLLDERLLHFSVRGRSVPCKLYWPDSGSAPGLLFYCHGGGFRHGSLSGWDAPLRQLVRDSGVAVLSIEYALAPEAPFPIAFDEVCSITQQVIAAGALGDFAVTCFALGGDSAGANLALGAAVVLRQCGVRSLQHLLLFYGVFSTDTESDSWQRLSGYAGHALSADSMRRYWASYLQQSEADWRAQPLQAELAGLPVTRLVVGDLDPLLDENLRLHQKLLDSGVQSQLTVSPSLIHGVLRFCELAGLVRDLIVVEAQALRRSFTS